MVIPIWSYQYTANRYLYFLPEFVQTDTDIDMWFRIQIKPIPIPIIGINRIHTHICIPMQMNMKPIHQAHIKQIPIQIKSLNLKPIPIPKPI